MYLLRSHPAADLQFYLNGNRVKDDSLGATEISRESDGLLESSYRWVQVLGHKCTGVQVYMCTGVQMVLYISGYKLSMSPGGCLWWCGPATL